MSIKQQQRRVKTVNLIMHYDIHEYSFVAKQTPGGKLVWQNWNFLLNSIDQDYDYLAVYGYLPTAVPVRCPPENTIHIATEPPAIARHDDNFLAQFGCIITQDANALHQRAILGHGGLLWAIGESVDQDGPSAYITSFEQLEEFFDTPKKKLMSVVVSNKATRDGHAKRLHFVQKLKKLFGNELDVYGRGINPIQDKSQALLDYRFHIALENSSVDHYFTEKITDSFIAGSYPIYYGCPNIGAYFPENSHLPIDLDDFAGAVATIRRAIDGDYDLKYRNQLRQAKDLTMHEYNIYPMLARIITELEQGRHGAAPTPKQHNGCILPHSHKVFNPIGKRLRRLGKATLKTLTMRFLYVTIRKIYLRLACRRLLARSGPLVQ